MGELDSFCYSHGKSEQKVLLNIIISKKVYRHYVGILICICSVCNCHHSVGFLEGDEFPDYLSSHGRLRKKSFPWSLLVMFLNCLYRKPKLTAIIIFVQCKMLIIDVSCFV